MRLSLTLPLLTEEKYRDRSNQANGLRFIYGDLEILTATLRNHGGGTRAQEALDNGGAKHGVATGGGYLVS